MSSLKILIAILLIIPTIVFSQYPDWNYSVQYVKIQKSEIHSSITDTSQVVAHVKFGDRLITVNDSRYPATFGWQRIIFPVKGYIRSPYLTDNLEELKNYKLKFLEAAKDSAVVDSAKIDIISKDSTIYPTVTQIKCTADFALIKSQPYNTSETVGYVNSKEPVLILLNSENYKGLWLKTIYPYQGYIERSLTDFVKAAQHITVAFYYGVENIPYEKNMENLKNPLGAMIIYDKSSWFISPGIGINYSQIHLNTYYLKTLFAYLFGNVKIFSLFNSHLQFYGTAGGGYWFANFQNTKYPELTSYYPLLKSKGFAYAVGGGVSYTNWNFVVGVQYLFWNSFKMAVFGKKSTGPGDFSNEYKLFPGANQLNLIIGYKINL
jgi:hypothetical protein